MARQWYLGDDRLLTAIEAAQILGGADVEGLAAAGLLTWETCADGQVRYRESAVRAHAARLAAVAPAQSRPVILTRAQAAGVLEVATVTLDALARAGKVPSHKRDDGGRDYLEAEIVACRDQRARRRP